MRAVVKDKVLGWREVASKVPQRLMLIPGMFLTFISGMVKYINGYASLFADNAKIMRLVGTENDS